MGTASRMLLADREPELLERISRALVSEGYQVATTQSGRECLAIARESRPQVIVLGVGLADGDAVETCRKLKAERTLQESVVVLAGVDENSVSPTRKDLESGPDDYILEPLSLGGLLARLPFWLRLQRTRAVLRASRESYERLIELLPDAAGLIDSEGRLLEERPHIAAMLGYEQPNQLHGKTVFDIASPEDHARIRADIKAVLAGKPVRNAEYHVRKRDGRWLVLEVSAAAAGQTNGGTPTILLLARDMTERREEQATLLEKQKSYQWIVETAQEGIWMLDKEGNTSYCNARMGEMLGYSAEEMSGRPLLDFMDEAARGDAARRLKQRQRGLGGQHDFCFRRKDGKELWAIVSAKPLMDEAGQYQGALGLVTDITERRQVLDALAASESRYRTLVELSPDAVYVNRADRITFVNAAAMKLFGASVPQQILGRSPLEFFTPESHGIIRQRRKELAQGQSVPMTEHKLRRLDGQEVDVAVAAAPFIDADGPAIQVILRDVTERKRAEAALRQREEMSLKILATAMDGFWMAGLDGRLREVNDAYCRMSGYSREELLSMHIADLEVNEPSPEAVGQHIQRVIQAGGDRFETRHRCKDGRVMDVEVSVNHLRLGEGCAFAFLRDISERKRTQEKLAMLAHAVESTSEPICITDLQDRFIFVNSAFHKIYGYSDPEILGSKPDKIASAKNPLPLLEEILRQTHLGGWRGELLDVRKDGTEFPVSLSSSQIKDADGRVIGLMGVAQDITERIRAEEALRESERKHRMLFETMTQGVVYQDAGGKIISMNPAAEKILGKTRAEFIGQTSKDTEPDTIREDGSRFPAPEHPSMRALRTGCNASDVMGVFNPREKQYRWLRISAVPLFHEHEAKPYQVYALFDDITERKRAQDELHEAHRKLTAILESLTDGFNTFDREWRYTYINPSAARTLGKKPEEILGKNVWEMWPQAGRLRFGKEFRRAVRENQPVHFEEFYPEPLNLWLETRCYPSVEGLAVFFTDITGRKRAEAELEMLRQNLAQAQRLNLMGELTAALAHELNQPLTAVLSNAQAAVRLLRRPRANSQALAEILDDIVRDDLRAAEVIRGLRSLVAKDQTRYGPVSLNEVVQQSERLIHSEAILKEITWTMELAPDLPRVWGDRIQLQQVLLNLVANSFAAMACRPAANRHLVISTSGLADGTQMVAVRDSGQGIAPERLERLFAPFFTTKQGGMGMGLAICRSIVEAHGGRIWAENNLDIGATLRFIIPAAADERAP